LLTPKSPWAFHDDFTSGALTPARRARKGSFLTPTARFHLKPYRYHGRCAGSNATAAAPAPVTISSPRSRSRAADCQRADADTNGYRFQHGDTSATRDIAAAGTARSPSDSAAALELAISAWRHELIHDSGTSARERHGSAGLTLPDMPCIEALD
jgi:hypothetical protein